MDFVVGSGEYNEKLYTSRDYNNVLEYSPMEYGGYSGVYATGNRVKALQEWLNRNIHPSPPLKVDGLYGEKTKKWVRVLQDFLNRTFRERLKVDGYYGCRTFTAVVSHYKQAGWTKPPLPIWGNCVSPANVKIAKHSSTTATATATTTATTDNAIHIAGLSLDKKMLLIGGGIIAVGIILLMTKR